MSERAILIVTMEPPMPLEEEFNDWYDTEHFPQRASMPGFESASRWVCLDGWPRWLALYDLASLAALDTPAYRAASGKNSTPWSRRVLPRTVGRERIVGAALDAQEPLQRTPERTVRLALLGFALDDTHTAPAIAAAVREAWSGEPGLKQLRAFIADTGSQPPMLWLLGAFDTAVRAAPLLAALGQQAVHTFNLYAPYRRGG